mmetsp:Transcript_5895/g.9787  ORF Transcript_5895/g.9787 Transcript_5895/m.9787 type:complete len:130 (-) Transcript_5895:41-430(-)
MDQRIECYVQLRSTASHMQPLSFGHSNFQIVKRSLSIRMSDCCIQLAQLLQHSPENKRAGINKVWMDWYSLLEEIGNLAFENSGYIKTLTLNLGVSGICEVCPLCFALSPSRSKETIDFRRSSMFLTQP